MHRLSGPAGLVLLLALPLAAQQQSGKLTLTEVLERARQSAPAIVAARMRVEEVRGRLVGAALPISTNPTIDVESGRRRGAEVSTDYGVEVGQAIDLPPRRRARIDAARAAVQQEEQRVHQIERQTLREVATAFLRALEARERSTGASSGKSLADDALRIAERRFQSGDVAQLDVNLARTAVARADAEVRIADATLTGNITRLQVLLGLTEPITVGGSLHDVLPIDATDVVGRAAAGRSDVLLLDAEIVETEADQRLARTLRWPDFEVRGAYRKEEGDRIVLGGVGITLPVFNRGQEATAAASARLARLRTERDALTRTIEAEVRGAMATHEALRAAASEYERTVLPLVEENEKLALESYEVGQIGLSDLLLVRREALDARRAFIDQLIETRLAEVELRTQAGAWPGVWK
jgi:cobalt-zinc-cadmium efflux system outer membrane protein